MKSGLYWLGRETYVSCKFSCRKKLQQTHAAGHMVETCLCADVHKESIIDRVF